MTLEGIVAASASLEGQHENVAATDLAPPAKWGLATLTLVGGVAALVARSIPNTVIQLMYGIALAVLLLGLSVVAKRSSRLSPYWRLPFVLFVFAVVQVLNNSIPPFVLTNVLHEQTSAGNPLASSVFGAPS